METLSASLALCEGNSLLDSPQKGSVMRTFGVSFEVSLSELMGRQSSCWWFETPWRLCNATVVNTWPCRHHYTGMLSVFALHYCDVIMGAVASQITSLTIVYSTVYADADQRKHQSSASPTFVRGKWGPVKSLHKWPVTRKMFPFDDVIMCNRPVTCS